MTAPATEDRNTTATGSQTETTYRLAPDEDEITHLVCCRDVSWRTAFCGVQNTDAINPAAENFCTMCLEAIEAMAPGSLLSPGKFCPVDGNRCPDERELDLRIARETDPSA